jgi:hypothetical protein
MFSSFFGLNFSFTGFLIICYIPLNACAMNEIQRSESPVNGVGCSQRVFKSLTVETVTEFMNSICLARVAEENGKFQALTAVLVKIPLLRDENHNILTYLLHGAESFLSS